MTERSDRSPLFRAGHVTRKSILFGDDATFTVVKGAGQSHGELTAQQRRILAAAEQSGTLAQIADATGLAPLLVGLQLRALCDAGVVRMRPREELAAVASGRELTHLGLPPDVSGGTAALPPSNGTLKIELPRGGEGPPIREVTTRLEGLVQPGVTTRIAALAAPPFTAQRAAAPVEMLPGLQVVQPPFRARLESLGEARVSRPPSTLPRGSGEIREMPHRWDSSTPQATAQGMIPAQGSNGPSLPGLPSAPTLATAGASLTGGATLGIPGPLSVPALGFTAAARPPMQTPRESYAHIPIPRPDSRPPPRVSGFEMLRPSKEGDRIPAARAAGAGTAEPTGGPSGFRVPLPGELVSDPLGAARRPAARGPGGTSVAPGPKHEASVVERATRSIVPALPEPTLPVPPRTDRGLGDRSRVQTELGMIAPGPLPKYVGLATQLGIGLPLELRPGPETAPQEPATSFGRPGTVPPAPAAPTPARAVSAFPTSRGPVLAPRAADNAASNGSGAAASASARASTLMLGSSGPESEKPSSEAPSVDDGSSNMPIPLVRVLDKAAKERDQSKPSYAAMPIIAVGKTVETTLVHGAKLDDFAVTAFLARGGSGVLYRAHRKDDPTGPRYALKVLKENLCRNPVAVESLAREAQLMGALRHPNLVALHCFGRENDEPFLLMEYVDGLTLSELLHHPVPIPLDVGLHIVRDLLEVLDYVHHARLDALEQVGLVHCDVSPQNLLVGRDGKARLVDFGTSRRIGSPIGDAVVRCKPRYSSPELLAGESVTPQSDVFAAGAVLFEVLSRQPAFSSDPKRRKRESMVPNPSKVNKRSPTRFDALCQQALSPNPAERFSGARAMLEALDNAILASHIELRDERVSSWIYRVLQSRNGEVEFALSELEDLIPGSAPGHRFKGQGTSAHGSERRTSRVTVPTATLTPADVQPETSPFAKRPKLWVAVAIAVACAVIAGWAQLSRGEANEADDAKRGVPESGAVNRQPGG